MRRGYAAVINAPHDCSVSFVGAKTKLAPMKASVVVKRRYVVDTLDESCEDHTEHSYHYR